MDEADQTRLAQQLAFLLEADGLKVVERRNPLADTSRRENAAEHSWHIALFALVLAEHAARPVDVGRVLQMLVLHDLVEIDAGDTFAYDPRGQRDKAAREGAAAERLFGLLPVDQAGALRALWDEFEAQESAEARFAHAMDRLQPILLNAAAGGGTRREYGLVRSQVRAYNERMAAGAPVLWSHAEQVLAAAVEEGVLGDG
jgi:putative hydrolases of HD superfamily